MIKYIYIIRLGVIVEDYSYNGVFKLLIRGLKDVHSDLNSFIEDFYSPENTYKRAKEKLLTGEYSDSSSRYFKFSTSFREWFK